MMMQQHAVSIIECSLLILRDANIISQQDVKEIRTSLALKIKEHQLRQSLELTRRESNCSKEDDLNVDEPTYHYKGIKMQ